MFMKCFKLILDWSISNVRVPENEIIPVRKNGVLIGQCLVSILENRVIGNLTLYQDINGSEYVLYSVSLPNQLSEIRLEGILLVDYYDGLEKRAKKIDDMI